MLHSSKVALHPPFKQSHPSKVGLPIKTGSSPNRHFSAAILVLGSAFHLSKRHLCPSRVTISSLRKSDDEFGTANHRVNKTCLWGEVFWNLGYNMLKKYEKVCLILVPETDPLSLVLHVVVQQNSWNSGITLPSLSCSALGDCEASRDLLSVVIRVCIQEVVDTIPIQVRVITVIT